MDQLRFPATEEEKQALIDAYKGIPLRLMRMHRDNGRVETNQCGFCIHLINGASKYTFHCAQFENKYNPRRVTFSKWRKKWPSCGLFLFNEEKAKFTGRRKRS
jgi:hypothetical protein